MEFDLFSNDSALLTKKSYKKLIRKTEDFLITPIRVVSLLIAVSGLFAMMFEVRYFEQYSLEVYITRLAATIIAFTVLVISNSSLAKKYPVILVHILLITIIVSSGYMIYLIPSTLITNSQIVGLMIFTSALFLSWEIKNQIIVAIYYNLVFSFAIIFNDGSIYFLPNMYESVIFVLFLSILSVIGSAVNFKLRLQATKNAIQVVTSEKRFRSIFNNSAEGIFQSTLDGKFIIANPSMVKILGYSDQSDLLQANMTTEIFKSPEDNEILINLIMKKGSVEDYQLKLKKKNGDDIIVTLNNRIFYDEEDNSGYLEGTIRDITHQVITEEKKKVAEKELREEKKRADMLADEAMKLSMAKSQFLAVLGHEIRTPINGISGYLSLIGNDHFLNKDELREFTKSAKDSTDSVLNLLDSILDLTKIESGSLELYKINFELEDIINQAISVNLSKIREKGLYISKEIDSKIPFVLHGDATRIKQIFVNLISNAAKFTEKGKIEIYSRLESISDNSVVIMSSIRDTGIGIPDEKFDSLFKPFSQVDPSHSSKYGGTGLGLMICKEFVNMMDGQIGADSAPNIGSTFHFTIKLEPQKTDAVVNNPLTFGDQIDLNNYLAEIKSPYDPDLKEIRNDYKILVAEDNIVNQKVLRRMLSELGFDAEAVCDGKAAVEKIKNGNFDAVLMDVQMPEMDGLEATRLIRNLEYSLKKIPIIALTEHTLKGNREKCLEAGIDDFIAKPINVKNLAQILDSWINLQAGLKVKQQIEFRPQDGVFDLQRFTEMSLGDADFQRELMIDYFEDLEQRLIKLDELFERKELESIIREAHTIKGSSFSLGAVSIGEEAVGIELSGKNNDWESVSQRIQTLRDAFEQTKEIVTQIL